MDFSIVKEIFVEGKQLFKVEEAARRLSLSRAFVYELVLKGHIVSIKIGRARRIPATALDEFIARQLEQQTAETGNTPLPSI